MHTILEILFYLFGEYYILRLRTSIIFSDGVGCQIALPCHLGIVIAKAVDC
jgi:hypothetical protein